MTALLGSIDYLKIYYIKTKSRLSVRLSVTVVPRHFSMD